MTHFSITSKAINIKNTIVGYGKNDSWKIGT